MNIKNTFSILAISLFTVISLFSQSEGTYFIQSAVGGKYLDVKNAGTSNGTPLQLWAYNGSPAQKFKLEKAGGGYFYLKILGKYVHTKDTARKAKSLVHLWEGKGNDNTKWRFVDARNGYYFIQSKLGTYLDVQWGKDVSGTPIWMYDFNGGIAQKWKLNAISTNNVNNPKSLSGWVDMHTHPMAHLAFGGKVLHGAPDIDILMPVLPGCKAYGRPKNISEALSSCNHTHGGVGVFDNRCGDDLRKAILRGVEEGMGSNIYHAEEGAQGYPDFKGWPDKRSLTHQQMYVDWIKRNYDNGLRVMVALAVNNLTYAAAFSGPGDKNPDDVSSANVQIKEMKRMVSRHSWMDIAYTSSQLRKIVNEGKLAIILGVEVDNIGNFQNDVAISASNPSDWAKSKVKNEIDRLFNQGIRYIFPVHVVNNKFGGTAVYEPAFDLSNYHQTGSFWKIGCASQSDEIGFRYEVAGFDLGLAVAKAKIGIDLFRKPSQPPSCQHGHINSLGLTNLGEFAVTEMMKRGMMIDIDHMSNKAVNKILSIAEQASYPLNSGHNSLRKNTKNHPGNERNFTGLQYKRIDKLGGMIGIGTAGLNANSFVQKAAEIISNNEIKALAIGSDANGMEPLPSARIEINTSNPLRPEYNYLSKVKYDSSFPKSKLGNKSWDFNKSGAAHYGLMSDFLKDVESVNYQLVNSVLDSGAEKFAIMWKKCEAAKIK